MYLPMSPSWREVSILCSCLLCQILIDHVGMNLFLGSLFCSIDLSVVFIPVKVSQFLVSLFRAVASLQLMADGSQGKISYLSLRRYFREQKMG